MDELFNTIGLVSAIIGGFAFTFVGAILTINNRSTVFKWVFGLAMFAASSLMAAAIGSVLSALAAKQGFAVDLYWMHQKTSLLFLSGILSLISSISLSGLIQSKELGYVSLGVGSFSIAMFFWVIMPYIVMG